MLQLMPFLFFIGYDPCTWNKNRSEEFSGEYDQSFLCVDKKLTSVPNMPYSIEKV